MNSCSRWFQLLLPLGLLLPLPARAETYPQDVVAAFQQSCIQGTQMAIPQVSSKNLESYCQCAIARIQSQVSYRDFQDLNLALATNQPLQTKQSQTAQAVVNNIQACTSQLESYSI